jgi:hypothetical protein
LALTHTRPFSPSALSESAWYWTLQPAVLALGELAEFPSREQLSALHAAAAAVAGVPALRFAPYVKRTRARKQRSEPIDIEALYDGSIAARGEVPTRDADWHDLFNALVFASFPRSKRALHARQFAQLRMRVEEGARRLPGTRSREQDALTLFDEGGTFVAGDARALDTVRALPLEAFYPALRLLIEQRAVVVAPFGHALFEHKVAGLRGPSSFAYLLELPERSLAAPCAALIDGLDRAFSAVLRDPERFCSPNELRRLDLTDLGEPLAYF